MHTQYSHLLFFQFIPTVIIAYITSVIDLLVVIARYEGRIVIRYLKEGGVGGECL